MSSPTTYRHVRDLWDDAHAAGLDPVGKLIYRSNLLGTDQRITNTGGGNTSAKIAEKDPLTGEETEVLWVKGSGGDLRTSTKENFSSLYQRKLIDLQKLYASRPARGPKTPAEDEMVGLYTHCTFNLNPRASSIDTPLHSFIPAKCVDHTHPNAVIAVAASANAEALNKEIFGGELAYTPWLRPGFELGLRMQQIARDYPKARGILMGQHGLINWAADDKTCYYTSLDLIEKAARFIEQKYEAKGGEAAAFGGQLHAALPEDARQKVLAKVLPWLRGRVSGQKRLLATVQDDAKTLLFVNSKDAPRLAELGTSCPDHFLRTKIKPLYVPLAGGEVPTDFTDAALDAFAATLKTKLEAGLEKYRADYAAYYERCKRPDSPAMRDPNPTVILIPGVGMVAWGKDKSESRVTAEFYRCAIEVMRGAEAIDKYVALPQQEAFDIEYWLLEEAKLKRMPPEKELARKVVVVVGPAAASARKWLTGWRRTGRTSSAWTSTRRRPTRPRPR
jgi:rhamnulose-1-phosphate aldolase/alcohol dehydrogenase